MKKKINENITETKNTQNSITEIRKWENNIVHSVCTRCESRIIALINKPLRYRNRTNHRRWLYKLDVQYWINSEERKQVYCNPYYEEKGMLEVVVCGDESWINYDQSKQKKESKIKFIDAKQKWVILSKKVTLVQDNMYTHKTQFAHESYYHLNRMFIGIHFLISQINKVETYKGISLEKSLQFMLLTI